MHHYKNKKGAPPDKALSTPRKAKETAILDPVL